LRDLALERRDLGLVVGQHGCLDFLAVEFTAVVLRQPELNEIGRQAVLLLGAAPTQRATADLLTQLQLDLRRVPKGGTS
jgi:hypothetical protein